MPWSKQWPRVERRTGRMAAGWLLIVGELIVLLDKTGLKACRRRKVLNILWWVTVRQCRAIAYAKPSVSPINVSGST